MNIKGLPDDLPTLINDKVLKALHELLLEVKVVDGELKCSKCSRTYKISDEIVNMTIREDEL